MQQAGCAAAKFADGQLMLLLCLFGTAAGGRELEQALHGDQLGLAKFASCGLLHLATEYAVIPLLTKGIPFIGQ